MPNRCTSPRRRFRSLLAAGGALAIAGCGSTHHPASTVRSPTPPPAATALEQQFVQVVRATQPEVVQLQTDGGLGSGIIWDAKGDIVTNAHVLAGAAKVEVSLADGRRYPARLVGSYRPDDLAVVKIRSVPGIKAARFADSSKLEVGEIVLAAGNPLGLQSSVTDGIISALGRTVSEGQGIVLPDAIQTSAPINPGNSGGALVDLQGQVIGVPTLAAGNLQSGGAAAGIGFAIPSNLVRDIAKQLVQHGRVINSHRAALGINYADNLVRAGVVVVAVQPGGAADRAGIVAGDTIESLDGQAVASADQLAAVLATLAPGRRVKVALTHQDGSRATLVVTLASLSGG